MQANKFDNQLRNSHGNLWHKRRAVYGPVTYQIFKAFLCCHLCRDKETDSVKLGRRFNTIKTYQK